MTSEPKDHQTMIEYPSDEGSNYHVLCVGEDTQVRNRVIQEIEDAFDDVDVTAASSGAVVFELLSNWSRFDVIVSTDRVPDVEALDLLADVRENYPEIPFVLYPTEGSETLASAAIRRGVSDYVPGESDPEVVARRVGETIGIVGTTDDVIGETATDEAVARTTDGGTANTTIDAPSADVPDVTKPACRQGGFNCRSGNDGRFGSRSRNADPGPDCPRSLRQIAEVAESTTDALWLFSGDWNDVLYANSACETFWDCSTRELAANPELFVERVHWADRESVELWMDSLSDGQAESLEYRLQGIAGKQRWVSSYGQPITDDDGTVKRIAGFTRDITKRKTRTEEVKRERYNVRRTEQIADVGSLKLTSEGTVQLTRGARRIYGRMDWENPDLEDVLQPFRPEDRNRLREAISECRQTGSPVDLELQVAGADGKVRWVNLKAERGYENDRPMLYGTIQDVTDRKEREQRLMVTTRVLRHNLRNKLTVVAMAAEHIESMLNRLRESAVDESTVVDIGTEVERILNSTDDLTRLGKKVNEFEQAISTVDEESAVDAAAIVERLTAEYRNAYPDATIDLSLEEAPVRGGQYPIEMAIEELLENSLQHGGDEPTVTIEVRTIPVDGTIDGSHMARSGDESITDSVDRYNDRKVHVRIADDGPGIPEMERKVIESGEESPLVHGSGIGLWTVNLLMTRCGGRISIEDNDPSGTIITLTFPASTDWTMEE